MVGAISSYTERASMYTGKSLIKSLRTLTRSKFYTAVLLGPNAQ